MCVKSGREVAKWVGLPTFGEWHSGSCWGNIYKSKNIAPLDNVTASMSTEKESVKQPLGKYKSYTAREYTRDSGTPGLVVNEMRFLKRQFCYLGQPDRPVSDSDISPMVPKLSSKPTIFYALA